MNFFAGPAAVATAMAKTSLPFKTLFLRGIMCNWLLCMSVYIASGCSTLSSKIVAIWFPASAIMALGLDLSVVNMFLIPLGIMRGAKITYATYLFNNLLPVTLGNIVGGAGAVGLGYSAVYGSLLDRLVSAQRSLGRSITPSASPTKTTPSAPYKVMNIRGG